MILGSYTDSAGLQIVREDVCRYLEARDGRPVRLEDLYLIADASQGIRVHLDCDLCVLYYLHDM